MPAVVRAVLAGGAGLLGVSCYGYFSGSPWFFQHVAMPSLRLLDPETAHRVSVLLVSRGLIPRERYKDPDILVSKESILS